MKLAATIAAAVLLASPAMADQVPAAAPQTRTVADEVNGLTGDVEISVANLRTYGRQLSDAMGRLQQQLADKDKQIAALSAQLAAKTAPSDAPAK